MDTQDLRLGNYVDWGGPKKVLSIASDTVLLEHPENTDGCKPVHIHNIKGVALTPEILERSGFVEDTFDERNVAEINGYTRYKANDENWDRLHSFYIFLNSHNHCCVHYLNSAIQDHPQYLHRLQNLIYSITGTELQYTP